MTRWLTSCGWLSLLGGMLLCAPARAAGAPPITAALLALDDGHPDLALTQLDALILAHPEATDLRVARVEAQAALDPWAFDAAVAQPDRAGGEGVGPSSGLFPPPTLPPDEARRAPVIPMDLPPLGEGEADLWERAYRLLVRARHERVYYQGDGPETPEAFIPRMDALAAAARDAVEAHAPLAPWGRIARWETLQWGADPPDLAEILGQHLAELPEIHRALVDWQLLEAMDRGELPRRDPGDALVDSPTVWAQRAALTLMTHSIGRVEWAARPDAWRRLGEAITEPTLRDDLELQLARELLEQVGGLEEARALLEPLARGPWNNSVTNATRSLGAAYRRVGEDDALLALYEGYNAQLPPWGEPIRRQYGRALYRLGHYGDSVVTLTRLAESPWGEGRDYLYLADAHRFVTSPEFALQLLEFASAVRERELTVEGWRRGWAPQLTEAKIRLFEISTTLRHARIFPATFVSMAATALTDALALALGLVVLAAFPRLASRGWRWGVGLAALGIALQGALLLAVRGEASLGPVATASWVGYGAVRTFLIGGAAVVMAAAVGLPGLGVLRALGRGGRGQGGPKTRVLGQLARQWPVLLGAAALLALSLPFAPGVDGSSYLARLPAALTGGAFGEVGLFAWERAPGAVRLYHALGFELLHRGLLLGLAVFGLSGLLRARRGEARWRWAVAGAVLVTAAFSAWLLAGIGAPAGDAFWLALAEGLVLGSLAAARGVDAAILVRLVTLALWGVV